MKKTIKTLVVVGARPNFIKVASLFEEFKNHKNIKPVLIHTGQHYDYKMSQVFFQELKIHKPGYNLGVGSGRHGWQTGKIMIKFEKVCLKEKLFRPLNSLGQKVDSVNTLVMIKLLEEL